MRLVITSAWTRTAALIYTPMRAATTPKKTACVICKSCSPNIFRTWDVTQKRVHQDKIDRPRQKPGLFRITNLEAQTVIIGKPFNGALC